jgi:hypothetical protein
MASQEDVPNLTKTETNVEGQSRNLTWSLVELSALILAKRAEVGRVRNAQGAERFETAERKWSRVEQALKPDGISCKSDSIKKGWKKLLSDFKKVYNYDRKLGKGQVSYNALDMPGRLVVRLAKICYIFTLT